MLQTHPLATVWLISMITRNIVFLTGCKTALEYQVINTFNLANTTHFYLVTLLVMVSICFYSHSFNLNGSVVNCIDFYEMLIKMYSIFTSVIQTSPYLTRFCSKDYWSQE